MKIIYAQACLIGLLLILCGCETELQQKVLLVDLHEKAKGEESRSFNFAFRMDQNLQTGICDITITITNTGDKPAPFPVPYPHPASHDAPFYFSLRSKKFDTRKTLAILERLHEEVILLPGCSLRIEGLTLSAFGYTNQVFFSYGKSMDMEMEIFYNPSPMQRGWGEIHIRKSFLLGIS